MDSAGDQVSGSPGRWVRILLRCREVRVEYPEGNPQTVYYSGILLTSFDGKERVAETWLPLGAEPSEADDERLINHLHEALLWQAHDN
jgi:hypothetical protein